MTDLTKLTAEELLKHPITDPRWWDETRRRLEELEEWKKGADILGERLITTEKRLERCEAALRAVIFNCGLHKIMDHHRFECINEWCKAARTAGVV